MHWLEENVFDDTRIIQGIKWPLHFITACSSLWYCRDVFIFGGKTDAHFFLSCRVLKLVGKYEYHLGQYQMQGRRFQT